ncbi:MULTISPECIES: recombinase family protein [Mesorhizobium]|uniref:recombinase family protein n=1 Tax=Mesorhizobium TaxID=68287 RepID=UPI0003CF2322|nr:MULTISPECIES: recombinase family protein [Mesorhizobium]ESY63144.1 hypothetical protein X742_30515 [Mesorhizobium sp. LNHC232B00]WJI38426.1 recombinase family protein [Mesorhizobium opportunistum]
MKVALGARYSTDNHRDASIEHQLRLCCLRAEKQGWTVVDSNTHRAICGASLLRPGLQELISDAMQGNSVLAEAMDRLTMTLQTGSRPGWANVATDPSRKFIDS